VEKSDAKLHMAKPLKALEKLPVLENRTQQETRQDKLAREMKKNEKTMDVIQMFKLITLHES